MYTPTQFRNKITGEIVTSFPIHLISQYEKVEVQEALRRGITKLNKKLNG